MTINTAQSIKKEQRPTFQGSCLPCFKSLGPRSLLFQRILLQLSPGIPYILYRRAKSTNKKVTYEGVFPELVEVQREEEAHAAQFTCRWHGRVDKNRKLRARRRNTRLHAESNKSVHNGTVQNIVVGLLPRKWSTTARPYQVAAAHVEARVAQKCRAQQEAQGRGRDLITWGRSSPKLVAARNSRDCHSPRER